ncbi:unnamed protein product [Effrenium voratum]|uniref:Uncharacterized protein n=1 Tax=Effrenium voratum TaxID=2562239 RepID=A0AA36NFL7_9DINO|nr:unnamed protein product [Effrenium voratum]
MEPPIRGPRLRRESDSEGDMWSVKSEEASHVRPVDRRNDDSEGDMWSVASEEAARKTVLTPPKGSAGDARPRKRNDRKPRLAEHAAELVSWYATRVAELERENKSLRSGLLNAGEKRFFIGCKEEEPEDLGSSREEGRGRGRSSLCSLFDVDWDDLAQGRRLAAAAPQRTPLPGSPDSEPEDCAARALDDPRQSLLALERLLGSLPEEQAKLIWWQFARYESELGYLRSVITSYEGRALHFAPESTSHAVRRSADVERAAPLAAAALAPLGETCLRS